MTLRDSGRTRFPDVCCVSGRVPLTRLRFGLPGRPRKRGRTRLTSTKRKRVNRSSRRLRIRQGHLQLFSSFCIGHASECCLSWGCRLSRHLPKQAAAQAVNRVESKRRNHPKAVKGKPDGRTRREPTRKLDGVVPRRSASLISACRLMRLGLRPMMNYRRGL